MAALCGEIIQQIDEDKGIQEVPEVGLSCSSACEMRPSFSNSPRFAAVVLPLNLQL